MTGLMFHSALILASPLYSIPVDWSNPCVAISWLEKPDTLRSYLVLQLLLHSGVPEGLAWLDTVP